MKTRMLKRGGCLIITLLALSIQVFCQESNKDGFVVFELFTSQGCSSCPPADKNIKKIGEEYKDQNVYVLAYHIDYWNNLGWKDIFSDRKNSDRQRVYAQRNFQGKVYTPQLVANGISEFNGSSTIKTIDAINKFKKVKPEAIIKIETVTWENESIKFRTNISGNYLNSDLNVALVENGLTTEILKGENGGRTLDYEHIVRGIISIPAKEIIEGEMEIPGNINLKNAELVFFIQKSSDLNIVGALSYSLKQHSYEKN